MSHSRPSGHRGPLFLGSLLVLLTTMSPEVVANFPNRYESLFQLPGPYVNFNHPVKPTQKSGAYGISRHRGKDASASLSLHPTPRWLQDVQDRAENAYVSPRAAKSFGRSFDAKIAKNRLDATEDRIARRSFFLYGSRRRLPEEPSREEKEYADVRRALAAQRETYAYQNEARAPKFSVVDQWPDSRRQESGRQRFHGGSYHGGPYNGGLVDRREACAMKMLDLDGDVCGFVSQLVQLGKLLKRRNLLLGIMSERRINSGSAVPQTLTLYVDGVIRDLSTANTGMKRFIDRMDAIHDAKNSYNPRSLFHGRRSMNRRKFKKKSSKTDVVKKASSIERPTNVTSFESSTSSKTLTNESDDRSRGGDFSVGNAENKINDSDGENNSVIAKRVTSTQTSLVVT